MGSILSKFVSALGLRQYLVTQSSLPDEAIDAIELEPRVLYSATPLDVESLFEAQANPDLDVATLEEAFLQEQIVTTASEFSPSSGEEDSLPEFVFDEAQILELAASSEYSANGSAQQLVFIDTNVDDWQQLLVDLKTVTNNQNTSVVLLDAERDGIEQISETLAQFSDVVAIHLISHGSDNQLNLGATTLTDQNLDAYAGEIALWRNSLVDGADFLIYGCNLAASESGRDLIDGLGALCDCDIAASGDLTGHSSLGGDWDLEYRFGLVEAEIVISAEVQNDWIGSLANFTVTTTADNGSAGTLRWAINQANSNGGLDTIDFNLADTDGGHVYYRDDGVAGSLSLVASTTLADAAITDFDPDYAYAAHSWFKIDINNALSQLSITDTVIIDGYSQSGASENTLVVGNDANLRIELTTSGAGTRRGLDFNTGANSSILQGLAINDFGAMGILVNYDVHDVTIRGNFIGTDITGTIDLGNNGPGMQLRSNDNMVGGPNVEDRNIISGNDNRGIAFFTWGTISGNVVQNNYIGVDATGLVGIQNDNYGIQLWNDDGTQIIDNVISGNEDEGILFRTGSQTHNAVIQGNMIGVGADGTTSLGNGTDGIRIESDSATGNQIGGTGAGEGNVIADNGESGILLTGSAVSGNTIVGNSIGTDASGLLNLGNSDFGVLIENGSFGNTIGGTTAVSGNKIAFNRLDGVSLKSDSGNGNAILGNSIFENVDLGIDLNDDNESNNDDFDADGGANTRINFPVLTSAITNGSTTVTVSGWFNSTPGVATYRLEFFSSPTADPGGNGEGQTFIGTLDVITGVDGVAHFNQTFLASVGFGEVVSATATDSSQNTSEFSLAVTAGANGSTTNGIWMSTENNVSVGGASELGDWTDGEVLSFGGPTLELEPVTTIGNFASVINLDLLGDGDVDIDGIHYVSQDVTVGTGVNSIDLLAGDVLISTADNESFFGGTMLVDQADLFLYRPVVVGDHSIGTMKMVLDMDSAPISDADLSFGDMWSVTLVENDVAIGGYDLFEGEILFTRNGAGDHQDVYVFHVTDTGFGTTNGTADKLIEGTTLGFTDKIYGLDIVERSIVVGDETLSEGSLLISLDNETVVLDADADLLNDLSVTRYDIMSFDIARTEMTGGTASLSAKLIFEGADVNIDSSDENIDAFTIVNTAPANVAATDIFPDVASVDEFIDTTLGHSVGTLTNDDPDTGDTFTYSIAGGVDAARFTIGGTGLYELILTDGILDHETKASFSVDVQVNDSFGNTFVDTIMVSVNDLNDQPVITSDGGGTTAAINVAENTTAVTFAAASDEDVPADTLTYTITGGADQLLFTINGSTGELEFGAGKDFETFADADGDGIYDVQVTVDDGLDSDVQDLSVTVTDVNEAPTVSSPIVSVTVDEDAVDSVIDLTAIFDDVDTSPLIYTVQSNSGPLLVDATIAGDFLTLDFLADQFGFAIITVRAFDGTFFVEDTFNITVNPINDAPVLTGNGGLPTTLQNDFDPSGETIGTLLLSLVTDVDPVASMSGVAVIGNTANPVTEGEWEYSTDSGSSWHSIAVVSDGATALALSSNSLVRFVPVTNFAGTPTSLEVRVIDDTYTGFTVGLARINIDSSLNGGITSVSMATANIETSVAAHGILVTPISGLTTNEAGGTDSFQVVLLGAPTASVSIAVASNDLSEGLTSISTLTFDATNWNQAQTVIVTGVDDLVDDGDIGYTIVLDAAVSSDASYNGLAVDDVSFINVDDDSAGVIVSASSVITNESGLTATFEVSLSSRPLATVTIGVSSNDPTEGIASTSSLTFDPSNWNVPQTVTITGQPDTSPDGNSNFQIVLAPAVSSDPAFNSIDPVDVDAVNNDFVAVALPVTPPEPEPEPDPEDEEELPEAVDSVSENSPTVAAEESVPQLKSVGSFTHTAATSYQNEKPDIELVPAATNYWYIDANPRSVDDQSIESIAQSYSYESVISSSELWNDLDNLKDRMNTDASLPTIAVGSVASMASALTVGYVTWLIRGGQILVGVLARMPAWKLIDPLPILAALEKDDDESDDDSLASMVDQSNEKTNSWSELSGQPNESVESESVDHELTGV